MMSRKKISDEQLRDAVSTSTAVAQVLQKLGIRPAGGSHFHYSNRIAKLGLDTSHFTGKLWNKGKRFPPKRTPDQVLVIRKPGRVREKRDVLVRVMKESGLTYTCAGVAGRPCAVGDTWNGEKLVLQVDHINGDWDDNRLFNLRFLCPNCHSQTSTYGRTKRV
jgi:hypothetical protein